MENYPNDSKLGCKSRMDFTNTKILIDGYVLVSLYVCISLLRRIGEFLTKIA